MKITQNTGYAVDQTFLNPVKEKSILSKRSKNWVDEEDINLQPTKKMQRIENIKTLHLDNGLELQVYKEKEIGQGMFKKVNLAQLKINYEENQPVVFAKFNKTNDPTIEREQHILTKIHQSYPKGCRGLENCLAIYEWKKGQVIKKGFVLPFYNGKTLNDAINLSKKEAFKIALDIAYGLQALHKIGILHHDLKPDNICLERDPITNEVIGAYIIDFGLSADLQDPEHVLTINAHKIYGSPELNEDLKHPSVGSVDEKSDVYSFGKILPSFLKSTKDSIGTLIQDSQSLISNERPSIDEFIGVLEMLNKKYA